MRLGRLPHDPARVNAVEPHRMSAEAPPPLVYPPPPGFRVELGYNATLPTCCVVGMLNAARLWCIRKHGFDLRYQITRLLDFYALVDGCAATEEAIAATDGLLMLDVLETAMTKGFRINEQDVLVPASFKRIETADTTALRQAIAECGSSFVGVDLRQADMTGDWVGDVAGPTVGGHCTPPIGYDPAGFVEATWGEEKPCDDAWMLSRVQEAYRVEWAIAAA